MTTIACNPEQLQRKVSESYRLFQKTGRVTYPEQRAAYRNISRRVCGNDVVDVGCGIGWGSSILSRFAENVTGIDICDESIRFCREMHDALSCLQFHTRDARTLLPREYGVAVAVELLEHVEDDVGLVKTLIECSPEVWITTPVRPTERTEPPDNGYHVREYNADEFVSLVAESAEFCEFYDWLTLERIDPEDSRRIFVARIGVT